MEIRIGITQVARELMVEVSSDALVAKAREANFRLLGITGAQIDRRRLS